MNYEEKYKDALERMKSWVRGEHPECFCEAQKAAEFIFPELKEDNNERVRKGLIKAVSRIFEGHKLFDTDVTREEALAWLEKQGEPEDKGEISDGYHTFNELYSYRMLYNAAFFNLLPKELVHKSKRHHDGKECFGGGWFIVMANLPTGQISNHYELKDWDLFQIPEKEIADEWDGHTPQEAAERLYEYLLEKQGEKSTIIDVDKMVFEYSTTEDGDLGFPINCMIRAYRKGVNDALKLSKERFTWKSSKEQIAALRWVLNNVPYTKHKEEINGLLDQIKDL